MRGRLAAWVVCCCVAVIFSPTVEVHASLPTPSSNSTLSLRDVLDSVESNFPLVLVAREQLEIAGGELQSAQGAFDIRLGLGGTANSFGFYENEMFDVVVEQPIAPGGIKLLGGYRLGQGDFATYDKGLQTNEDGEVNLGLSIPLLRDQSIDKRRVELWRARLELKRADPEIEKALLSIRQDAALSYWRWVAAGQKLPIAEHLLELAEDRQSSMEFAVEEGLIARIELSDNERLIAERRAIRIKAERSVEKAAIALSLYLRDTSGNLIEPAIDQLPRDFPATQGELSEPADMALATALEQRPELRDLSLSREQLELKLRKARNDMKPRLDLLVKASRDLGAAVNVPDDKGEFEMRAGVMFSVPVQRREARGDVRKTVAERSRLDEVTRMQRDEIQVEVQDAVSAQRQAWRRIAEAERSVALAGELESAERFQVEEGNSDLLRLNIRERQAAEASAFLVDVKQEYFEAWTRLQVVTGNALDLGSLIPGSP